MLVRGGFLHMHVRTFIIRTYVCMCVSERARDFFSSHEFLHQSRNALGLEDHPWLVKKLLMSACFIVVSSIGSVVGRSAGYYVQYSFTHRVVHV